MDTEHSNQGSGQTRTDRLLCGLDEAGRGPLAGPLVAAAVVFPLGFSFTETFPALPFGDSKKLSKKQRERLISFIYETALVVKTEIISVEMINDNGIGWANRTAFERLIMDIDAAYYIIDGNLKLQNLGRKSRLAKSLVNADDLEQTVSAASIIAKVTRDRLMEQYHAEFPVYGWDKNSGYGTKTHIAAIREHGTCIYHRHQFVQTALTRSYKRPLPGFNEPTNPD